MEDSNHLLHQNDSNNIENDEASALSSSSNNNNHGWQKVTYTKRRKNQQQQQNKQKPVPLSANPDDKDGNVFKAIEQQSEDRHRRIVEARKAAVGLADTNHKSRSRRDDSDDGDYSDEKGENGVVVQQKDEKKVKKKKKAEKKPKITVPEAASKIDASDLAAFLVDVSGSYESQEDIQLMRFADYFGRAFSGVGAAQFPWVKTFRESPISKIVEIPLSHIPEAVYRTSVDWINQRSVTALNSFVLLLLDSIIVDLSNQLVSGKNAKKATPQPSSKSQVAIFVVLAMVLRRKPDVLVGLLPTLRDNSKYQGQDKLPVIIWMISQACQGDLAVGLYAWSHNMLPLLNSKSSNNPLTRDLILQLVERILASPKARPILVNGAVRKGERLIPPAELDILMRVTFPSSSARVKATERFQAVYPTLKEVALAGAPGSRAMKQVSQQIFGFAITAAGEGNVELSNEATSIAVWCLTQNSEIYKHWEKVYLDNLEASVVVLKKLSEEWREQHFNQASLELVKHTFRSFHQKNEQAFSGENPAQHALLKDANKYCKTILGRLSRSHGCLKGLAVVVVALAVGAAVMSPNLESFDWKRLSVMLSSFQSV